VQRAAILSLMVFMAQAMYDSSTSKVEKITDANF